MSAKPTTPATSKEEYARICPKCNSIDISLVGFDSVLGGGIQMYRCNSCNHISPVFPEAKISDLEKSKKKK
ncbi:MAG: hypothetical protein V1660_02070 [archaeon]